MKKIITLVAATALSTSASAGYVQYDLSGPGIHNGIWRSSIVIREEDKSVAFYAISTNAPAIFTPSESGDSYHRGGLIETTTSFTGLGPTNIFANDILLEDSNNFLWLLFSEGDTEQTFNYTMRIVTNPGPYSPYPQSFPRRDVTYTGTATQVPLRPNFEESMATMNYVIARDIPYYDPTQVPEPASVALIGVGALGVAALRRRRKPQH